ncbi:Hypp2677 [Branchiostoma lanceolatum]|uniref:Hypp2677 protein n=1 Tax=Branchiostoma lanceolatum TaxID=7740 RepID=A0A8J9ZY97_BRALA|nr:Hypp2677 [Branchiostoma lanceolatum]
MMNRRGDSTPAIVGGVCGAAVIFIIGGVAVFILWRRKFRSNSSPYTGKGNNRGVTMSSLQNGHPNTTDLEGTVDNEIYAGDNAGIVDNVIYEGGMGADGVFSNPGYADKTPQFKPRMDAPGAFVQPNPGATNKTPTPQRNIIIEEPQYAQIVDDQYADPQKVRDRKDKKNKKKATKDENYADLKGPHEKQPGANNSNSNHIYQGLNKGTDYQSLRGPREHHQVKPSQVPKTPQDEHDYTSLTPGRSKPSAGTLSKEEADYTVLEGPESPGEETAAGPDYTTLDGPDSPGDEITSGPDYTVLDGPDSPGD